jgi:hypothetical protein
MPTMRCTFPLLPRHVGNPGRVVVFRLLHRRGWVGSPAFERQAGLQKNAGPRRSKRLTGPATRSARLGGAGNRPSVSSLNSGP